MNSTQLPDKSINRIASKSLYASSPNKTLPLSSRVPYNSDAKTRIRDTMMTSLHAINDKEFLKARLIEHNARLQLNISNLNEEIKKLKERISLRHDNLKKLMKEQGSKTTNNIHTKLSQDAAYEQFKQTKLNDIKSQHDTMSEQIHALEASVVSSTKAIQSNHIRYTSELSNLIRSSKETESTIAQRMKQIEQFKAALAKKAKSFSDQEKTMYACTKALKIALK